MKRFVGFALVFVICCSCINGFAGETGNEPYPEFKIRNGIQFNMKKEEVIAIEAQNAKRSKTTMYFRSSSIVFSENASSMHYLPEVSLGGLKGPLYYGFSDDGYLKVIQYQFTRDEDDSTRESTEDFAVLWESITSSMLETYGTPTHIEEEHYYWTLENAKNPDFYVVVSAPISPDIKRYNITYLLRDYRAEEQDTLDEESALPEIESDL